MEVAVSGDLNDHACVVFCCKKDGCDGEMVFWSWFEFGGVVLDGSGCMLSDDDVYLW